MDAAIQKTNERLDFVSQDKEVLCAYHMREMAQIDWNTGVSTALEKQAVEIAKSSLHEGLTVELIKKITGLDMETIQSLQ
jgi:hypothetical protein